MSCFFLSCGFLLLCLFIFSEIPLSSWVCFTATNNDQKKINDCDFRIFLVSFFELNSHKFVFEAKSKLLIIVKIFLWGVNFWGKVPFTARFPFTAITTIMNNNNMQPTRACSNSSLRSAPATRKRSRQCFLNQKTGQRQKTLKSLTQSLKDLSSGSPVESLLEFYLFHSKQGTKYMKRIKRDITTKKIEETMKNVGELC